MLTRDNTTSTQSDNVEDIGKINNSLMIEAGVKKMIGQLKDDFVYLLNDAQDFLQDKLLEFFLWMIITGWMKFLIKFCC